MKKYIFLLLNTKEEILNNVGNQIKECGFLVHMNFHKIFWLMYIVFLAMQWKLKENATVFPYSNMFFPQLRRVDMYLSRLSLCT